MEAHPYATGCAEQETRHVRAKDRPVSPPQGSRVAEAHTRKAADLFNRLLAEGEEALAPYRSEDYREPCVCGERPGEAHRAGQHRQVHRLRQLHPVPGRHRVHVRVHEAVLGMNVKFRDLLRTQRRADYEKEPRDERKPGEWIVRFSDVGGCGRQMGYRNGLAGDPKDWPYRSTTARRWRAMSSRPRCAGSTPDSSPGGSTSGSCDIRRSPGRARSTSGTPSSAW
jgi:hypothetical protein